MQKLNEKYYFIVVINKKKLLHTKKGNVFEMKRK